VMRRVRGPLPAVALELFYVFWLAYVAEIAYLRGRKFQHNMYCIVELDEHNALHWKNMAAHAT
jgi:hypothetical protein